MSLVIFYRTKPSSQLDAWLYKNDWDYLYLDKSIVLEEVAKLKPEQVVIDIDKFEDPLIICQKLKVNLPSVKLIVTSYDNSIESEFHKVGVSHFVLKKPIEHEMIHALSPKIKGDSSSLSERQKEILRLLILGHTNKNIAEILKLSIKTVEAHRTKIFRKMGASNVADLTYLAVRSNMVDV